MLVLLRLVVSKLGLVFFISCCFLNILNAQIPNSSFEEWEEVIFTDPFGSGETFIYEKPIGWETNQQFGIERLHKSIESYDANYSLKLFNSIDISWGVNCQSQVTTSIDFTEPLEPNKSLFFYYKSISNNSDGNVNLRVLLKFYQNGGYINQIQWANYVETPDFTLAEIPLTTNSDSIVILIEGGAMNGGADDCGYESTIWIDNLNIDDSILSITETSLIKNISLYPNPVQDILNLSTQSDKYINSVQVYDLLGKLVTQEKNNPQQIDVSLLKRGVYLVKIETDKGVITKKVVKE